MLGEPMRFGVFLLVLLVTAACGEARSDPEPDVTEVPAKDATPAMPLAVPSNASEYGRETAPNLRVAFIGDQGSGRNARAVLDLIKREGADLVIHLGDFDYDDDPEAWDSLISEVLGEDFPYFAAIGNHDEDVWPGYQQRLLSRLQLIEGARCVGDYGVNSACTYEGLFFVLSGIGTVRSGRASFIEEQLAANDAIWSVCGWHKNQKAMQVGGKDNDVGWDAYETCREGGAIIGTGHEHSYERTKTLSNVREQELDGLWAKPGELRVGGGSTFVFVSGLGGRGIRDQERCRPTEPPYGCSGIWASIYTSDQGATFGALFIDFHVDGDPSKARGYFKNIEGEIIDNFTITADPS